MDGFSLDQTQAFFKRIIENAWPQIVAVDNGGVAGWCDVIPSTRTGFKHVGHLGMGVRREYRRRGLGRRLLEACLSRATAAGIERVELEVFSDNAAAIGLYESHGFKLEGVKVGARKLEGRCQDIHLMALSLIGPTARIGV